MKRIPGKAQGWTLVATMWLAVIATSLIAPVLPRMAQHFSDVPGAVTLVQLSVALPALFVALFAGPMGYLADKAGRRVVLWISLLLYSVFGTAPLWLNSVPAILLSRCGVGIAEAAVMTASTTLLGDYFKGESRERWLAIQTGSATLLSIGILALGGFLGEISWRAPFAVYALPLTLVFLVLYFTWEPTIADRDDKESAISGSFRWRNFAPICAVTLFGSMAFYVVIIQLGFILTARGFSSPALIGVGSALCAATVPVGAILFRLMRKNTVAARLVTSFALSATGFMVIGLSHSYVATIVGGAINGIGSGVALPALLTWAVASLPPELRGRGVGAWQVAFFLGQFLSPISVVALTGMLGDAGRAVLGYGVACVIATLLAAGALMKAPRGGGHKVVQI